MTAPVEDVISCARTLLQRVIFDERGTVVAGKNMGGNGGLLSRETIIAAEHLHRALGAYDAARGDR